MVLDRNVKSTKYEPQTVEGRISSAYMFDGRMALNGAGHEKQQPIVERGTQTTIGVSRSPHFMYITDSQRSQKPLPSTRLSDATSFEDPRLSCQVNVGVVMREIRKVDLSKLEA